MVEASVEVPMGDPRPEVGHLVVVSNLQGRLRGGARVRASGLKMDDICVPLMSIRVRSKGRRVNGGVILGRRGGAKAGRWRDDADLLRLRHFAGAAAGLADGAAGLVFLRL